MAIIVVMGPPGAGKGTRIKAASYGSLISISTGEVLRRRGFDTSSGNLVSDEIVMNILKDEISAVGAEIIILDGVPRNISQAEMLDQVGIKVDKAIVLQLSEEEAVKRALSRYHCPNCGAEYNTEFRPPKVANKCDHCFHSLVQRDDDKEDVIRHRMQVYEEKTAPLVEWYKSKGIPVIEIASTEDKIEYFVEEVHR